MRLRIFLSAFCILSSELGHSMTFTPIARLSALGGQYYTGSTHSTGANIDYSFVPVLGLNSKLYLIPIVIGAYKETQSVYNFLGENTLIQKQLEQTGVVRFAYAVRSNYRLKPRVGYKRSWVKQSTDGSLTGGLFNYGRAFMGISTERILANGTLELGYEYSQTRYPNYTALDADPRLTTTGITASAGTDVLNFNSHEASLNYQLISADKRWGLSSNFAWLRETFVDQKVISQDANGFESFVDKKRTDDIFNLALQQTAKPSSRWTFGMSETFQYYLSNQNAFDATQLFVNPFTYRYYNFYDAQLAPSVLRAWGEAGRWETTLAGQFGYRRYTHRRTQNGSGTYQNALIYSASRGGTFTLRYKFPKIKGLSAILTSSVLTYWSNTRYEANYPYNYTVYNYQGGLSWEY